MKCTGESPGRTARLRGYDPAMRQPPKNERRHGGRNPFLTQSAVLPVPLPTRKIRVAPRIPQSDRECARLVPSRRLLAPPITAAPIGIRIETFPSTILASPGSTGITRRSSPISLVNRRVERMRTASAAIRTSGHALEFSDENFRHFGIPAGVGFRQPPAPLAVGARQGDCWLAIPRRGKSHCSPSLLDPAASVASHGPVSVLGLLSHVRFGRVRVAEDLACAPRPERDATDRGVRCPRRGTP